MATWGGNVMIVGPDGLDTGANVGGMRLVGYAVIVGAGDTVGGTVS